ncbi:MAG: VPA1262 family N-terminal domain-containing protein [Bdellovibrionales bacterium]|nr:VPA1262 family N-terminal domain-containing protein [Bdellovibrionales bacterium]
MFVPYLSSLETKNTYDLLTSPGNLAFYDAVDIYCVFYLLPDDPNAYNLFSLLNFYESRSDHNSSIVNPYPMRCPLTFKFSGRIIKIGLKKITVGLHTFQTRFYEYLKTNSNWNLNGSILNTNSLKFIPKFFVPPADGTYESPLNNILKNNFFNGSYVLEQFDEEKTSLEPFFQDSKELLKISAEIQKHWPLKLAKMTDRLGNILYQFPITVFRSDFLNSSDEKSYKCTFSWDSRATPSNRDCIITTVNKNREENLVSAKSSVRLNASPQEIVVDSLRGRPVHFVYDITNGLILGMSSDQTIKAADLKLNIERPEPRIFEINGKIHKVNVFTPHNISVGTPYSDNYVEWSKRRVFEEETHTLEKTLQFKQYGLGDEESRSTAIKDIRQIINEHAKKSKSVYLWDPYLDAKGLKNTLFFIETTNVECRAISSSKTFQRQGRFTMPNLDTLSITFRKWWDLNMKIFKSKIGKAHSKEKGELRFNQWKQDMCDELSGGSSSTNNYLLNLKFKCQYGRFGRPFHDRFIIFPMADGHTKCWSIGTSINSLGKAHHHIIQEVSNAKQIEMAFDQLWQELPDDPCLVWSST